MAVVVEQTIPFQPSTLDLENPTRWNSLLPLIRPSVKPIQTTTGATILLDTSLASGSSKKIHVAAVGTPGNFSSTLLDDRKATAIVPAGQASAQEISKAIQAAGSSGSSSGVVVVRAGKRRHLSSHGSDLLELETDGALELDHALLLLASASSGKVELSLQQTAELLETFVKGVSVAHTTFHVEKAEGNPAVLQVGGPAAFEKAKHAVERDLKHVLRQHEAQKGSGDVVFSVHYSDVNGLSRLENYILAKEIAQYLDASNIPYNLSHSTILNHKSLPRGFSISICPIPTTYLTPKTKPTPHQTSKSTSDSTSQPSTQQQRPKIPFNDSQIRSSIRAGCEAVIAAEPTITNYDTIVGDGDCGYTLRDGAKQVLAFISDKNLGEQLPVAVGSLVEDLEVNMGGTSGALYCIFLTALAGALASEGSVAMALKAALGELLKYTRARKGDRTMMDALIPFVESFAGDGDVQGALEKAEEGVEGTKRMQAKLGRSTYLDEAATQGVPDPGAYGLFVLLSGMAKGA